MLKLQNFTMEYMLRPALVPTEGLRFGWQLQSDRRNTMQRAYRLTLTAGEKACFDSGWVQDSRSFDVTFPSMQLAYATEYTALLEVEDTHGETASLNHTFSTGLSAADWESAAWIKPEEHISGWAPYLRTKFTVEGVRKAVLYACGLGCGEYWINGQRTDDFYIDPPMTNYEAEVYYRRWDVTSLLHEGGNALTVLLGEGFYSQSRVWGHYGFVYGDVCVKLVLDITLADGSVRRIVSDTENWKYKYSPITVNNIYGGETYDCRLETPDFAAYDGSEHGWGPVIADETKKGVLRPCMLEPVREIRTLPARSVKTVSGVSDGAWVFDLGENFAGICEFRMPHSPRGAVYVFRFAEALNEGGGMDYRSIGTSATQCIQQEIYICRGTPGGEVYRPRFCYHGFRYVEMTGFHDFSEGYGTMPKKEIVTGIQLSTDLHRAGTFHCDNGDLNRLQAVMDNTFRSNFHGLPEDCPAREKCGWLGDAQICANWGILNYAMTNAYEKYLSDIRTTREVYGTWMMIAPGKRGCGEATPLWGCAQVLIPYDLWRYSGDREAVIQNFDAMEAWVAHEFARAQDSVISEGLGDWCTPVGPESPKRIPVEQSSTFMLYEICVRMEEMCRAFGLGDAAAYHAQAETVKESILRHFYDREKHTYSTWAANGVALTLGVYPDGDREAVVASLLAMMREDDYAMPTGIYGNKYLVPVLCEEGHMDLVLEYLFNRRHRGFGRMLDDDGTTIWESFRMDSVIPAANGAASYNHPMHGGFLYFLQEYAAGLRPLEPGYTRFALRPCHGALQYVSATLTPPVGEIAVRFSWMQDHWEYTLTVPAGASCVLDMDGVLTVDGAPAERGCTLGSGVYRITEA